MAELEGPGRGIPVLQPLPSTGWLSGRHPGERDGVALRAHPAFCCPHGPALLPYHASLCGYVRVYFPVGLAGAPFLAAVNLPSTFLCALVLVREPRAHVWGWNGYIEEEGGPAFPDLPFVPNPHPWVCGHRSTASVSAAPTGVRGVPCGSAYASLTTGLGRGGGSPAPAHAC